eukprot:CAMPEP_0172837632 /NCGR_PEP_ID=MMETSP1075-20121228/27339_1 /TAXON_ID=2916 /ORGANISM="Ceratium fusus, Strain PA161109" /LENGTH=104 /DNA_ID=CAMNT_0013681047 /DNA_START=78 /DNA_END=390 /DNA_ORIENTATION=+
MVPNCGFRFSIPEDLQIANANDKCRHSEGCKLSIASSNRRGHHSTLSMPMSGAMPTIAQVVKGNTAGTMQTETSCQSVAIADAATNIRRGETACDGHDANRDQL